MNLTAWGGAGWDPDADPTPVKYLVAQNGIFRIFTTPVGRFQLPWPESAPEDIEPAEAVEAQVTLTVPRIPRRVLDKITHRLRTVQPQEHLLNVYWHRMHTTWILEQPLQTTTAVAVEATSRRDPYDVHCPRVLQIHSHGLGPACFSAVDDADEIACGLYGVMGEVTQERPMLAVRLGMAGQFLPLPFNTLFEEDACHGFTDTPPSI